MNLFDRLIAGLLLVGLGCGLSGCRAVSPALSIEQFPDDPPRELSKAILPPYTIEPPDILVIDAIHVVPKAPYRVKSLDALAIHVTGTLPDAPIEGTFPIEPGGIVNLGFSYGAVEVAGLAVDDPDSENDVKGKIEERLMQFLSDPQITVTLADMAAKQQIAGEHLVGPDGMVTLGSYGSVSVVGMTIAEAKSAIEKHLDQDFLDESEVSVDVFAYNSKVYYVVTQGAGLGDGVFRFPVTGNETVLDAISQINGLEQVSSKRIWIARAGADQQGRPRLLPVDWNAITQLGDVGTNFQILPGDRVYIAEDKLIALDTNLAKLIAPVERIMGFTLLGATTATRLTGPVLRGGGNPSGGNR